MSSELHAQRLDSEPPPTALPLPPVYVDPEPPQPIYALDARADELPALVPFRPQFGAGVHLGGSWSASSLLNYAQGSIGIELLFRVHPRVTLELSTHYERSGSLNSSHSYYDRTDSPLLAGLRLHLGHPGSPLSPYLVGAVGADYAQAAITAGADTAWLSEWQGGFGLEGRAGRHFALGVDLRAFGRARPEGTYAGLVTVANGNTIPVIGTEYGIQIHTGFDVYF